MIEIKLGAAQFSAPNAQLRKKLRPVNLSCMSLEGTEIDEGSGRAIRANDGNPLAINACPGMLIIVVNSSFSFLITVPA